MPAIKELSPNAKKVLEKVNKGVWFAVFDKNPRSHAMDELIKAGLVREELRVKTLVRCFVPAVGYRPYQKERFDEDQCDETKE